jgi:hypothetical protein
LRERRAASPYPTRAILGALEQFGWRDVRTRIATDHQHGPSVNLVGVRR